MSRKDYLRLVPLLAMAYRFPLSVTQRQRYSDSSYAVCPRCSNALEREYMAYCDRCGQRLDWRVYSDTSV